MSLCRHRYSTESSILTWLNVPAPFLLMDCCASLGEDVTKFFLLLHQALRHILVLQTVWKKILMIAFLGFVAVPD